VGRLEEFLLVEELDEVKKNMVQFNNDIKENEELRRRFLSHFRQWYYIREIDMFAPSKFIGYKNMNANRYNNKDGAGADGRKTEVELRQWFVKKEVPSLHKELQERFGEYGKIKESSELHILKSEESYFKHLHEREGLSEGTKDNGKLNNTLNIIPALEPVERSREYNLYEVPIRDRVVYESLFHGRTRRWLDENVIGLNPDESRGYQAMGILHFIGLKDKHKGIFKEFSIQEAIQLLEQQSSDFSLVIQSLLRYYQENNGGLETEHPKTDEYIDLESIVTVVTDTVEVTETDKEQVIKSRIGQSTFKKALLDIEQKCRLCGIRDKSFLVASHIKPWSKSNHQERLDVNNGLLLCPNHDSLFDKGYISFEDDGIIMISDRLDEATKVFLNINESMNIRMNQSQQQYVKWHREYTFKCFHALN
jgi:hypothetical protein